MNGSKFAYHNYFDIKRGMILVILALKNIGRIKNATVKIDGITVIAGANNTGKSTVGKVLFSIFNSFYKIEEQINKERLENIKRILDISYNRTTNRIVRNRDFERFAYLILDDKGKYSSSPDLLKDMVHNLFSNDELNDQEYLDISAVEKVVKGILDTITISDEEILKTVFSKKIDAEFNSQINNIYEDSEGYIKLTIKDETTSITVKNNIVKEISKKFSLNTEAIYIDDPFVLDEQRRSFYFSKHSNYLDHRNHLKSKLFNSDTDSNIIKEIIMTNKLEKIYSRMNEVVTGKVVETKSGNIGYRKAGSEKTLDIKNISAGLKTFVILKTLLENGTLEENGTIILDEPEIHLHPEWQLLFAELIVLIQKEFGMHILLNTHSPYFLNAIEVYAAKVGIEDKCNYYISESEGDWSSLVDVTDKIELIYQKLARPLQNLENERYNYD